MRQVLVYQGESGLWVAEVPSLPGCVSQGETREEAILNVREAIGLHTESLLANRQEVPPDRLNAVLIAI
ncbi:MAG: type II toxin-antitoxin system HicB family antitoxin [Fimbriimonadaceae bacterium]|nr:type II toxin-antitoxin system HicB family antitoxin [Fimbriimonadaceae bacterium]